MALKNGHVKAPAQVAKIFEVPDSTLHARLSGRQWAGDTRHGQLRLSVIEEGSICQYILDLDTRGYPLRYGDLREFA